MPMIRTVLRISLINLVRDRTALLLTFALPIIFFSVFAVIFGGMGSSATSKVKMVIVDEDQSEASKRFAQSLEAEPSLVVHRAPDEAPQKPYDRAAATELVKSGKFPVAAIIPKGFSQSFGAFGFGPDDAEAKPVELISDEANPVAPQMVGGLMQKAAMTAAPDLMIRRGLDMFDKYAGGMTPKQKELMDGYLPQLRQMAIDDQKAATQPAAKTDGTSAATKPADASAGGESAGFQGPVQVKVVGLHSSDREERSSLTAFQAAGTGVMFLLFSMAGAAGTLLEEQESGSLERLLISNIGMTRLLMAKWLFIAIMGMLQVALMFCWGSLPMFGVDLWSPHHLAGFIVMTVATAGAAGGFGMLLATACKSRAQLSGVSTIVILIMSAVGGSMVPRWAMPDSIKQLGLATFNGWALDGYYKVFWYENHDDTTLQAIMRLWPQVAVLAGLTVAFLVAARLLARRWEAA